MRAAKPIPAERVIRIGRGRSEGANPGGFLKKKAAIPALLCS
jgi:hypothetical protein